MIPDETLKRVEFDKLLRIVASGSRSQITEKAILAMKPVNNEAQIKLDCGRTEEIRGLLRQGIELRISRFEDIFPVIREVRPEGAILPPKSLLILMPILSSITDLYRQFYPRLDIPLLKSIEPQPDDFSDILEQLHATLDDEGNILDSASRELSEIRKSKRTLAARVRKKLEEIVRKHETAIFLQDDFITIRSGRWVIPVRMDSKGMVPGVVHDVSSSGETAFMEPLEIIPFVNELENLAADEKAEEIRILRRISAWIREDAERIKACFTTMVELDRLDCIASFSERYSLSMPELNRDGKLRLLSARHPLLLSMRGGKPDAPPVQPLDLELGNGFDVLVISGPNAGGKTIALKTVGLLTAMALSGMPVPASPSSSIPLLDSMLVDIGDEQSIESSLSTFSAHVAGISRILDQAGKRCLVLLDELGTGTEPIQGSAIGCAVLNELKSRDAIVMATTHLTEIVGFVQRTQGMQNAGMEFDNRSWTPLYRLVMGEPGQSHALETARRYGLPEKVINFARTLLGDTGTAFAEVIEELRTKRDALAAVLEKQELEKQRIEATVDSLEKERQEVEELRLKLAEQGRRDARAVAESVRRELNMLLDEYRKEQRKDTAEKLRKRIDEIEESCAAPEMSASEYDSLKPGTQVHLRSLGRDATIVSLDRERQRIRVRAGSIEMEVPINAVSKETIKTGLKPDRPKARARQTFNISVTNESSSVELNLIGKRVDEALVILEAFIDQSVLAGHREIRIIHGIGTGALQHAAREFLGRHPQVASFRAGGADEGRDGATVALLE